MGKINDPYKSKDKAEIHNHLREKIKNDIENWSYKELKKKEKELSERKEDLSENEAWHKHLIESRLKNLRVNNFDESYLKKLRNISVSFNEELNKKAVDLQQIRKCAEEILEILDDSGAVNWHKV